VSADTPTASPVVPSAKAAKRTSLRMLLIRVAALVSALGVIALSIIAPEFRKEDDRPPISRPPITSHIDAHPLPAIQIQTDPPGASIYEGGKLLGSSPLAIARPADDITRRFTVRGSDGSEMPLEVTARSGDVVMLTMHSEEPPAVEPVTPPPVQVEPTKQIPRRSPTRPRQPQAQPVAPDDLQRNPYPEPSEQTPRRAPVSPRQPRTQPVAPDDILLNPYR
jgi:hypothetical protein